MSQGDLFGAGKARAFVANIDGGSRGNPGPAAAGWVIRDASDGLVLIEKGVFLGSQTNNHAEYMALIHALEDLRSLRADSVLVRSDSELLVRQMKGQYRVKNEGLKGLFERAKRLSASFPSFHIEHVRREQNRDADREVNAVLAEKAGKKRAGK